MILIFFVVAALAIPSLAADYKKVGVSAGDWMDYSVSYYSTSPNNDEYVSDSYNKVHIDVYSVMGTNVTLRATYFYPDHRTVSVLNVDTSRSLCYYLTAPALEKGDPVYIGAHITVKESTNMTVLQIQRYVNIIEPSTALDAQIILYFDQATGILVESHRSSLAFGWMVERIASTSVNLGSQVNPVTGEAAAVASIAIVAMILATFAIMNRRRRD
jgi:hypothetical protein